MLQGASIPLIAKMCAAFVVTTGAGVATYEIAIDPGPEKAEVVVDTEASGSSLENDLPAGLAFAKDGDESNAAEKDEVQLAKEQEERDAEEKQVDEEKLKALEEAEKLEAEAKAQEEQKRAAEEAEKAKVDDIAPDLAILHPEDGSHFDTEKVVFEGEAEPGAIVKAGRYEADVKDDGSWRIELVLSPGANRAVISAYDAAGNVSEASVTVHLDVEEPKEKPKEEEPKNVEFTANQKFGSCEEEVPYDIFWGTATPNTVVHIVSEFGGAEVEVGKHGHWEKKVFFENAPRGHEFAVVIEAENGRKVFEFVAREIVT